MRNSKAVSVKNMQMLDKFAIEKIGVPSIALMENAGCAVAAEILKGLKGKKRKSVCIFCGLGNNAGDGFVIARHLLNAGIDVKVFLVGSAKKLKKDALINYKILRNCKVAVREIKKIEGQVLNQIKRADILVDALFGTGLSRCLANPFKSVIIALNASKKRIVAVDIPSGLDGTTGDIYGVCIKAYKTVTFACAKKGFYKRQGPKMAGKVIVVDIGIPKIIEKRFKA